MTGKTLHSQQGRGRSALVSIIALCLLLSLPIFTVLWSIGADSDGVWQHLADTLLWSYIGQSLTLMTGVGLLVLVLGVVPAWLPIRKSSSEAKPCASENRSSSARTSIRIWLVM